MTESVFSNYSGGLALSRLSQGNLFLACHTDNPNVGTGLLVTEAAGNGYIRHAIRFTSPSGRGILNTSRLSFDEMPACTIKYFAVWDQITNGNLIFTIKVLPTLAVDEGQSIIIEANDLGILI